MKPKLARDIIRGETAYAWGRTCINALLLLFLVAAAAGIAVACLMDYKIETAIVIAASALLQAMLAVAGWELAHCMFDRADATLRKTELE